MSQFYETIELLASQTLEAVTGFSPRDFEIHQVTIDSSALYQEIDILFSYQLDKGIFRSNKQLREVKYDFSNKCGVMLQVSDRNDRNPKTIQIYGDEGILQEKDWI